MGRMGRNHEMTDISRTIKQYPARRLFTLILTVKLLDVLCTGVGTTLGTGLYVLTAEVAKTQAGPAVVFSFIVAALDTLLAGNLTIY